MPMFSLFWKKNSTGESRVPSNVMGYDTIKWIMIFKIIYDCVNGFFNVFSINKHVIFINLIF